ncbi:alkaline phosphatase D family protein [Alcaligenes sp. SORT26]|uniref:alkaline phosphatase D family protein n=1 Tax=Alcaligenes sp. SORT26 TaxID=2813780 RepID=UPI001A9DB3B7|nr:alkaline phosphatase D family protein [Alcaligenes sp. SORT26]QTC00318.1 alkaline phosphatase D family protein [Alcaligenes sp. SORT26]
MRRLDSQRLVLWLVGSSALSLDLILEPEGAAPQRITLNTEQCRIIPIGTHAHIHLIDVSLPTALPSDTLIHYDLITRTDSGAEQGIADWAPHLLHTGQSRPSLVLASRADNLMFGSCRKPHHPARDGLAQADTVLSEHITQADARPALLMLCGDQVYADDVAGPMLAAIHALIDRLGLFGEYLEGAVVSDSESLYRHPASYYRRADLLPAFKSNEALRERFFGGVEKPIFTTANAHNHLVTLSEVLAMYLLVWSPIAWQIIPEPEAPKLEPQHQQRWLREASALAGFRQDLPQAARLLAHVQTLMIFDDHDITDDWNLSAKWESIAYGHPFSRQIVGNALIAYMLCQGWGNRPEVFESVLDTVTIWTGKPDQHHRLEHEAQDMLIKELLDFRQWDYVLRTQPTLIVLDTRTRRWHKRRLPNRPSGLMDWESLTELQHELLDERAAIIVSPTPMFGVKLIEVIQSICTYAGFALTVDAENWMAHRGAANTMLNIFRHSRTPGNYVILSGDVHYSFVYDVQVRHSGHIPHIWQVTSSGIKNEFPEGLLNWLDRLNRWLYSPRSPLNWFTQRRDLSINPRLPDQRKQGERVWNGSGLGQIWLDEQGRPARILHHNANKKPPTEFPAPDQEGNG